MQVDGSDTATPYVGEPAGGDEARDPRLREQVVALVDVMVAVAGSNRRLEEASGVSETTIRNLRRGQLPLSSTAKAEELDAWAHGALAEHPAPGAPGSLADLLARWQGRPAPGPEEHPSPGEAAPRPRRRLLLAAAVVLAGAGALVAVGAVQQLGDGTEPSGVSGVRVARDLPLTDDNFCSWVLGRDPVPLVSVDPLVMRVDARCSDPAEPDPVLDVGSTVYDAPDNDTATRVGALRSGNTFVPECWTTSSDVVVDGSPAENRSAIWVRAEEPAGWLPVVNLGGGYTEDQLQALGLEECPAR